MRHLTLLALPLALALAAAPALAVDWDINTFKRHQSTSSWEGYDVGTSVTKSMSMGPQKRQTRKTLMKIEADKFTIKVETKSAMTGDKWQALPNETETRKKNVKFSEKELGAENVTIGTETYACKKIVGTMTKDGKPETMTFWVHEKHGVVQFESKPSEMAPMTKLVASKLSVQKKVGDHTFKCREFSGEVMGGKMAMTIALHSPDRLVAMKMESGMGNMSQAVTAVTIKKAAALTGAK